MKYKAYSKEFKLDALNLVKTNGFATTARDLGISETSLRNWQINIIFPSSQERPAAGLIIHTDQGSQYCCESYQELLKQKGFKISMSRRGNCYDNAFMESFFRSLKVELINRFKFEMTAKVRAALFRYFEIWYNRQRMHSSLSHMCPIDYEKRIAKKT